MAKISQYAKNKSAAEIRALGAAGKLTAQQLTEGLRQSLEANTAAAAGMSNNLVDASVRIKTAITSILVAFENETGVIQEFTNGLIASADSMLKFSQDSEKMTGFIDAATTAATVFSGVIAARDDQARCQKRPRHPVHRWWSGRGTGARARLTRSTGCTGTHEEPP